MRHFGAACLGAAFLFAALADLSASAGPVAWTNVSETCYVSGRKCSPGYLQGKVVLVCRDKALAERMEEVWQAFKTKPFVLMGAFRGRASGTTYPVYEGAALESFATDAPLYVVDGTGAVRYRGADDRRATESVVTAITDMESPRNEAQWRAFLEHEITVLPGRAVIRFAEFKKRFPRAAAEYESQVSALGKSSDVKKLVELVKFSKAAKDARRLDPGNKKDALAKKKLEAKIKAAVSKFSSLKESRDPLVAQEAKNALADLVWTGNSL